MRVIAPQPRKVDQSVFSTKSTDEDIVGEQAFFPSLCCKVFGNLHCGISSSLYLQG
jgi:hypothetical protein